MQDYTAPPNPRHRQFWRCVWRHAGCSRGNKLTGFWPRSDIWSLHLPAFARQQPIVFLMFPAASASLFSMFKSCFRVSGRPLRAFFMFFSNLNFRSFLPKINRPKMALVAAGCAQTLASFMAYGYTSDDIGNPVIPSTVIVTSNEVVVSSAGYYIGGTNDQFNFEYQLQTGISTLPSVWPDWVCPTCGPRLV